MTIQATIVTPDGVCGISDCAHEINCCQNCVDVHSLYKWLFTTPTTVMSVTLGPPITQVESIYFASTISSIQLHIFNCCLVLR